MNDTTMNSRIKAHKFVISIFAMLVLFFSSQAMIAYYQTSYNNNANNKNEIQPSEENELNKLGGNSSENSQFENILPINTAIKDSDPNEASSVEDNELVQIETSPQDENVNVAQENPVQIVEKNENLPKRFEIPKLGIATNIQLVGLNSAGEMDVPNNNKDVAWFHLGTKPGDVGSAVIAGHLDSKSGTPAIFWNLKSLTKSDVVYVVDSNGKKNKFEVMYTEKYNSEEAPMEKIFGADDGAFLNLITCNGVWDKSEKNYNERLVVYTKLVL